MPFTKGSKYGLKSQAQPSLVRPKDSLVTDSYYHRLYGPGVYVTDYIGNLWVGDVSSISRAVSHRFRATQSSNVISVKTNWPPGVGYAAGNGGTVRVRIMPDDGTADHFPDMNGTALSTGTLVLGMSGGVHSTNTQYTAVTMTPASSLAAGTLYHVVYDNTAADPATNYFSVNNDITMVANGHPARWAAVSEWATLYGTKTAGSGDPFDWTDFNEDPNGGDHYCPMLQIGLSNGNYIGSISIEGGNVDSPGYIWDATNSAPVRERFTPSLNKSVIGFSVQTCARVAGTLLVELKYGTEVLDSRTITEAVENHSTSGGSAVLTWYDLLFTSPITLIAGRTYDLTFTPQGASEWVFADMRNGSDYSFVWKAAFTESQAEHYQAAAWRRAYHWDHTEAAWGGGSNWRVVLHLKSAAPTPPSFPTTSWPLAQAFTPLATVVSNDMSVPALRTPVIDATFPQTYLTRISDASEIFPTSGTFVNFGPVYANRQHWNLGGSRMIVTAYNTGVDGNYAAPYGQNYHLLNGTTHAYIGVLTGLTNHWRWSNSDSDEILFVDWSSTLLQKMVPSTLAISTVKDFAPTYDLISNNFCGGVGEPDSRTGRYWALGLRKSGTNWFVVCWDRVANSVLCEIPVPVEPGTSYLPAVTMSTSGTFIVISGTSSWTSGSTSIGRGMAIFNQSGTYLRSINETGGSGATDIVGDHNSVATDVDGNDVVCYFHDNGTDRRFVSRRLDTDQSGTPTNQTPANMVLGSFYVTPYVTGVDGWVVVSDYPVTTGNTARNGYPLRNHIWAFKIDGSETVYPICESRFSMTDFTLTYPYLQFPWATPNRDMTQVMFKSSMDTDWTAAVPTTFHAYIAKQ